jgi:hypothetical protein
MILNILNTIKKYLITSITIIFIIAIFIGIVALVIFLKKSNKKLKIIPQFEIVDCKDEPQLDSLTDSINIARDILSKVNK